MNKDRTIYKKALTLKGDLNDEEIRQIRANVQGMTLYQYNKYLREIGLDY